MLHWSQVWKQMRLITNKEVEKGAIMELFISIEDFTNTIIQQSLLELDLINASREKQGLSRKERIDRECVKRAIKSISQDGITSLPEKAGGILQEEKGEENVEHTSEPKDMGVEIIRISTPPLKSSGDI